jgi:hypothetical protein
MAAMAFVELVPGWVQTLYKNLEFKNLLGSNILFRPHLNKNLFRLEFQNGFLHYQIGSKLSHKLQSVQL